MSGHALATPVMMQLGAFQFGINTAAYQGLSRSDEWRWPDQERFGQPPALQHTGPGATTITLDGILYPGCLDQGSRWRRTNPRAGTSAERSTQPSIGTA